MEIIDNNKSGELSNSIECLNMEIKTLLVLLNVSVLNDSGKGFILSLNCCFKI